MNGGRKMVPMRMRTGRALAVCLIGAGCAAWGLAGGLPGTALAAAGSQCEALPVGSSASASASQAELCVSVQASQSGIKRGQAASFTVQVSVQNGSASGVSVTLAASPQGQAATFTGRCPAGNGSATCAIGSLGTSLAPTAYSLQAQIPVAHVDFGQLGDADRHRGRRHTAGDGRDALVVAVSQRGRGLCVSVGIGVCEEGVGEHVSGGAGQPGQ